MEESRLSTWGVKVTDEVRDKLKNAMEVSGLQGKDFIESMICLYETSLMKESQPVLAQELTELETITRRIINMFVGLGERFKTVIDEKDRQQQGKQEQNRETNKLLEIKIKELEEIKNELIEQQKEKVNLINGYITEVNQLTKLRESNEALIEEYKQKNDNLTGLIGEYKQYKDALQSIKADKEAREKELIELKNKLESLKNTITEKESRHKEEIQDLKDRLDLGYEKKILKLEKEYQAQIQSLRDEYNQKVRELLQQMQQPKENS